MSEVGLFDKRSVLQVIGCCIKQPMLLEDYKLEQEDFNFNEFYEMIFSCIYNLYNQGIAYIDCFAIDSFLSNYEEQYKTFEKFKGVEYCTDAIEIANLSNFEYYYQRLKKFSYLRFLENRGCDTRVLYDSTIVDPDLQEKEQEKLDGMSLDDMIDYIDGIYTVEARLKFGDDTNSRGQLAGKGMKDLKEQLKQEPEFGIPLQSPMVTTIARGARLGKLYMRSSNSGGGKTRTAMADLCGFSVPWYYDVEKEKWIHTGFAEPALFISTELEEDEIQTLIMAYVSGVNEAKILDGTYTKEEEERIDKAIEYINSAPLYFEVVPDFSVNDITNLVKKYKREKGCLYFVFDYVHMSAKLINEVSKIGNGMKLREDQILFLTIDTLKNLCNKLKIFMLTMTQLNGSYKDTPIKDETMLRGWVKSAYNTLSVLSNGVFNNQNNMLKANGGT